MHIAVVGTGFVGLVIAACFAENGNTVVCVDDDASAIRTLQKGRIPIYEPGLEEIVRRNGSEGRLTFTTSLPRAVRTAQVVFLTVGAPVAGDGASDGHHVLARAREVARAMNGYKVVVSNCAAPVGTAERVRETIRRETTHPFSVVSNPEFLEQGAAVEAFLHPDHIVIGADDPRGAEVVKELYAPFARAGAPMMVMDCASAELSRYVANAMLATRISFMNEVAHVCELTSANVDEVRRVMASDGRIGAACLFPGVGYGGSSLPRDSKALLTLAKGKGYTFRTLEAVESVNAAQKTGTRRQDAASLRLAQGSCGRGVGAGLPAADRRHVRGALDGHHRDVAAAGREDSGVRSRSDGRRARALRVPGDVCAEEL